LFVECRSVVTAHEPWEFFPSFLAFVYGIFHGPKGEQPPLDARCPDELKDSMLQTLQAADIVGIRALLVHAKDHNAKLFYQRFDFIPSPTDPLHLLILRKDVRKIVA